MNASQRDASGGLLVQFGDEQAAARRRVIARKSGDFLFEILERKIDIQPGRIFAEHAANFRKIGGGGGSDGHVRSCETTTARP